MNSTSIHCEKFNDCVETRITVGLNVVIYELQESIYFPKELPSRIDFQSKWPNQVTLT
jgi:hypothetical protein